MTFLRIYFLFSDIKLICNSSESSYLQGVPIAPLWDFSKGKFVGVLSALDFILIMREVGPCSPPCLL